MAPKSQPASGGAVNGQDLVPDLMLDPDPLRLIIRGLSEQGFLLAEDDFGRAYELTPDGNSLDMMKGLIRRKM